MDVTRMCLGNIRGCAEPHFKCWASPCRAGQNPASQAKKPIPRLSLMLAKRHNQTGLTGPFYYGHVLLWAQTSNLRLCKLTRRLMPITQMQNFCPSWAPLEAECTALHRAINTFRRKLTLLGPGITWGACCVGVMLRCRHSVLVVRSVQAHEQAGHS